MIKLVSQWIEFILRQPGDTLDNPKVIKLAATGAAAYLIGTLNTKRLFFRKIATPKQFILQVVQPFILGYVLAMEQTIVGSKMTNCKN